MTLDNHHLTIPSNDEHFVPQLKMMLAEAESILDRPISLEKWLAL
jgi:hypothetical protein